MVFNAKTTQQLTLSLIFIFSLLLKANSQREDGLNNSPNSLQNGHGINGISGNSLGSGINKGLEPKPVPKFGEVPTNRVLPVDLLTEADYEDEDIEENEIGNGGEGSSSNTEYCKRLIRSDLLKVVKRLKARGSRQNVNPYLEGVSVSEVISPLLNIMGSAIARNATAIDQHYKRLPLLVKTEVTDFISLFADLLSPDVTI